MPVDGRTIEPIRGPTGVSGTPARASSSAKTSSGGAHTRTSAPSSRNCTASATTGSTSPRDPYVDNTTRTAQTPKMSINSAYGQRLSGTTGGLRQVPQCAIS